MSRWQMSRAPVLDTMVNQLQPIPLQTTRQHGKYLSSVVLEEHLAPPVLASPTVPSIWQQDCHKAFGDEELECIHKRVKAWVVGDELIFSLQWKHAKEKADVEKRRSISPLLKLVWAMSQWDVVWVWLSMLTIFCTEPRHHSITTSSNTPLLHITISCKNHMSGA